LVPPVIAYGTRATATRCWHFAVQSTTVHWIRCLCGINNGNVAHKNHLMLPPCRTALLISICYKCIDIKSSMIEYMEIAHDRFIIYMKEAINKSGIFSLNWLRVFRSAEASRMGQGGRQQRHTRAVRSEKCVGLRGRAWDGNTRDRRIFWPVRSLCTDSHVSVFSHYFKRLDRFVKLATSSLAFDVKVTRPGFVKLLPLVPSS